MNSIPIAKQPQARASNRRGLLKCMAWAGTGVVWAVAAACRIRLG